MTEYVLRLISPPGKTALAFDATAAALAAAAVRGQIQLGNYLEWSDPNAKNGMGDDRWTADIAKAKKFPSFDAAMACWNAVSLVRPLRPDGKPNKPMTSYSVTVEKL